MTALFSDDPLLQEYREWLPVAKVGSLGGSQDSTDIRDYYLTPFDIGYGKTVRFDHDFVGREALQRLAEAPPRRKVTLVWNADDVTAAVGSMYRPGPGAKYIEMRKARCATHHEDKVLADGRQVGISLACGYLANERVMLSLATLENEYARPGTEVTVVWGEQPVSAKPAVEDHVQVEIRATVAPVPFVNFARESYRSR
jgi:vanillate/3-O-methylgallate O-demethylase